MCMIISVCRYTGVVNYWTHVHSFLGIMNLYLTHAMHISHKHPLRLQVKETQQLC